MGIVLSALLLYVLVSSFNDGIEDEIRWKVFVIAGLVIALELGVRYLGVSMALALAALLGSTILIALLLVAWCKLSRAVAGKVAASFLGIRVALGLLPLLLQRMA
ncbi:hypothetical protein [Steroidobacter sp.]|uniref:hypothetical protein n=1 Tax=Steroidobacter sp. TaxID=1978227 RepID=UPI001A593FE1|nr:hypothetical protein [Steroidobacter sp.]MBL8269410.1 hypothetical protein [Steroidobacter sp.]